MSRKASTIEYLERLVEWSGDRKEFCRLTTIAPGNLGDYLTGKKRISWSRLKRCSEQIFGEPPAFVPVMEGFDFSQNPQITKAEWTTGPGIYGLFDSAMRVLYYGKATNLYAELRQTLDRHIAEVRPWTGKKDLKFSQITAYISAYTINRGDNHFRHDVEVLFHKFFVNNTFNQKGGHFKRGK